MQQKLKLLANITDILSKLRISIIFIRISTPEYSTPEKFLMMFDIYAEKF